MTERKFISMKTCRILFIIITSIITISIISAVPACPYNPSTMIFYPELTNREKIIYDTIYEGANNFQEYIVLPEGTTKDEAVRIYNILDLDSPELFQVKGISTGSFIQEGKKFICIYPHYTMSRNEIPQTYKDMKTFLNTIDFNTSDLDREIQVHKTLLGITEYVSDAVHAHDAAGPLTYGESVCEGYAKCFALLMRMTGVRCGVVFGVAYSDGEWGAHAWNIIRIGNDWTLIDPTWNDKGLGCSYDYFNVSAKTLAQNHGAAWKPSFYEEANDKYEINKALGNYMPKTNQKKYFFSRLDRLIEKGIPMEIFFEDAKTYNRFLSIYKDWIHEYNQGKQESKQLNEWYTSKNDIRYRFYLE